MKRKVEKLTTEPLSGVVATKTLEGLLRWAVCYDRDWALKIALAWTGRESNLDLSKEKITAPPRPP
jgi:hypothetical protein